jgi:hypothetical protein
MKLAFKRKYGRGFSEKEVNITLKLGTLEAVCKALEIEFWQIGDAVKKDNYNFTVELLYQGYISACKDAFKKPEYTCVNAVIWHEYMSKEASKEFMDKMTLLFGAISKMSGVKKKVQRIK